MSVKQFYLRTVNSGPIAKPRITLDCSRYSAVRLFWESVLYSQRCALRQRELGLGIRPHRRSLVNVGNAVSDQTVWLVRGHPKEAGREAMVALGQSPDHQQILPVIADVNWGRLPQTAVNCTQKSNRALTCTRRPELAPVTSPKLELEILVLGLPKFG